MDINRLKELAGLNEAKSSEQIAQIDSFMANLQNIDDKELRRLLDLMIFQLIPKNKIDKLIDYLKARKFIK